MRHGTLLGVILLATACSSGSPSSTPAGDAPPASTTSGDGTTTGSTTGDDGSTDGAGTGGDDGITTVEISDTIPANRSLSALPTPPLTPVPSPESEPVRADSATSTISEFFTVRNPTRDLVDTFGILTDEDFAAGPLPPVYYTPEGLDTTTNSRPYFENLNDVEGFAGQEITVVFKPVDDDGGVPGLFPNEIPAGARYVDNFNGTRSLIWRPLQPQVGIREFTITATDPEEPYYRTERTIRIKVKMPNDPSTIENIRPAVNLIQDPTVRVNDPVVVYIKVDDANGTIPTLEILNPPEGSIVTPDPNEPKISILKFVPRTTGNIELNLLARDADDSSLTSTRTVTFEVLDDSAFMRSGSRLRDLATSHDVLIGYASLLGFYTQPSGALYADIAAEEFNLVSTENSLKWDLINPLPGQFRWAQADNLIAYAKARRIAVHGHTLLWHRQLPDWVKRSAIADREIIMREFIDRILTRYGKDVPIWDVVNEALEEDGTFRNSTWYEAMGASFIDTAFRQARASAPNAVLIYNDYDVSFAGPKADGLLALMQSLKDANTPVDAVGFQMHLDADFDRYDEVANNFQAVANMDFDIYITELDVSIRSGQTEQQQADVFAKVLSLCLEQPRCKAYQTWGFTDMHSWRRELNPLIMDSRYQPKPAYYAIQQRLSEN